MENYYESILSAKGAFEGNSTFDPCMIENLLDEKKSSVETLKSEYEMEYFEPIEDKKCTLNSLLALGRYKIDKTSEEKPFGEGLKPGDKMMGEYYEPHEIDNVYGDLDFLLKSCKTETKIEDKLVVETSKPEHKMPEDCYEPLDTIEDVIDSLLKSYDVGSLICEEKPTEEKLDSLICTENQMMAEKMPFQVTDHNSNMKLSDFDVFNFEDKLNNLHFVDQKHEMIMCNTMNSNEDKLPWSVDYVRMNKVQGLYFGSAATHPAMKISSRNPVLGSFSVIQPKFGVSQKKYKSLKKRAVSILKPKAHRMAKINKKLAKYNLQIVSKRNVKKNHVVLKVVGKSVDAKSQLINIKCVSDQVGMGKDVIKDKAALLERERRRVLASYVLHLREMMSPLIPGPSSKVSVLTVLKTANKHIRHLKFMLEELEMTRLREESHHKLLIDRVRLLKNGY